MNNTAKCIIITIIGVDLLIFLFVKKTCGPTIYLQILESISMQALSLLFSIDSKFSRIFINIFNINLANLKVAAFFIILGSFYLLLLAIQGVIFQNPIRGCA